MSPPKAERFDSVVAEAAPAAKAPPVASPKSAQLELLEGDEIIQLSIKPSLWFIPLISFQAIATLAVVAAALTAIMQTGTTPWAPLPFQILAGLAMLRLGIATLQWASCLYVLTNRRVMRFQGVTSVDVAECRLTRISQAELHATWSQRALWLGSIHLTPIDGHARGLIWEHVARPLEVHELVIRAIRKSQSKD